MRSADPNKNSASDLATSVFPVPVGPAKRKTPIGQPRFQHCDPVDQTLHGDRLAHDACGEVLAQAHRVEPFAIIHDTPRQTGQLGERGEQIVARD
jgi:hypothetical protein